MMEKTPLVLLSGTLCDELLWKHQIDCLSDLAEITVGDLTKDDSIEGMARAVLEQGPERFALAGLSMGGIVAIEMMRQAPERVSKLALLDTNPTPPRPEQITGWNNFIAMANQGEFLEITEEHLMPLLIHPDRQDDKRLVETVMQMAVNVGKEAMISQMTALQTRPDGREVLPSIKCPTLVLTGRNDALCPPAMHEEIAHTVSNSKLVIIEQSGHLTTLEQPQAVTAILRYWLQNNQ